ncbi:hypothetical protein TPR58_00050 [Sphingomonas sp. HF-S3]|uniref:PRTase-CE domain-containing protein n=1 Tax=Sphingomonas rustica TaxID=3103142 RepID=A0ABV0B2X2_9SPHN
MSDRLRTLLIRWGLRDWAEGEEALLDLDTVQYLGRRVWDDYEPAQFDRFENRLDRWLHNVDDERDQLTLFRLLERLFFVGRPEFESLCRAAFHGPVTRWLVEQCNIDIADAAAGHQIETAVEQTWFCPATDSMRINAFLKVNGLTGKSHRPEWRSLRKFGDVEKIKTYLEAENVRRLVLLEDFVGSGTQIGSVVRFAANNFFDLPVLACPLVVCPKGDEVCNGIANDHAMVSYEPALRIAADALFAADPVANEAPLHQKVRDLTLRVKARLGPTEPDAASQRHHGFKGTGAVVALYSNCPNNSLPILWDATDDWKPLFPRLKRA